MNTNEAQSPNSGLPNLHKYHSLRFMPRTYAGIVSLLVIIIFFGFVTRFGYYKHESAIAWLVSAWNPKTDYEHGNLVGFIILGMILSRFKEIRASVSEGSMWGMLSVAFGCVIFVAGFRTVQPRISVGAIPFIMWGGVLYLWGRQVAKLTLFPLFFIWIAIPLPTFQQATTHLQLLATSLAHHGSNLLGVETYTQGTTVLPKTGDWKPLSIAHGCSGIRSLMALLMISAAWAYLTRMSLWKRVILFLSAIPLAIIGNALRVISIFVLAEYGNAEWASTTWHDWSGLLLFYPFSLVMLLVIHSMLEGGLPWQNTRRRVLRKTMVESNSLKPLTKDA